MDKATKAVRRSGVRLLSLGGGHSDLSVLISEIKDMRNTAKAFMTAQNSAAQYMLKWAANEENRAIQDVAHQLAELNMVWTEVQKEFCEHLKEYRQMFEIILEGEKHVSHAKNNLAACEQREMKSRKELKKAAKKATAQEIRLLEQRLSQAERAKDVSQLEMSDRVRENEAVKLIRLKKGMVKYSEAYCDFGKKCSMLFEAQRDISYQLPDVHGKDLEDIKYTGSGATKFYVQKAKEKVRRFSRQSQHITTTTTTTLTRPPQETLPVPNEDPPPPYSPSDFIRHPAIDQPIDRHFVYSYECQSTTRSRLTSPPVRQNTLEDDIGEQSDDDCDDLSGAMGAAKL